MTGRELRAEGTASAPWGSAWDFEGDPCVSQAALRTWDFTLDEMGFVQRHNGI